MPDTPVFVLGMHRSGTSAVAHTIAGLGLSLGPPESLLPPVPGDNAAGYAEQRPILDLNEELLALLGGTWWAPPQLDPGWERADLLNGILGKAERTLAALYGDCAYVVKDPRMCVTLPFWLRACAPSRPRVVLCIRAPAAVARSLQERGEEHATGAPPWTRAAADALWLRHTADAWRDSRGLRRHRIVHERLIADPDAETARLAAFLGVAAGAHAVDPALTHHAAPLPGIVRRTPAERFYRKLAR